MKLKFPDQYREAICLPLEQPLLVRLSQDSGLVYQLPHLDALYLVRNRLATVVGDITATADVVIDEDNVDAFYADKLQHRLNSIEKREPIKPTPTDAERWARLKTMQVRRVYVVLQESRAEVSTLGSN